MNKAHLFACLLLISALPNSNLFGAHGPVAHDMYNADLKEVIPTNVTEEEMEEIAMLMDSHNVAALQTMLKEGKLSATKVYWYPTQLLIGGTLFIDKTLLMMAAENKNVPMVRALIDAGSDVNAEDHGGWTPLLYALKGRNVIYNNEHEHAFEQAQAHGRQKEILMKQSRTQALHEKTPLANELIGVVNEYEPDIIVPEPGQRETVRLLLDAGAKADLDLDVEQVDITPLMLAAATGDPELVKMILAKKVDVNQKSPGGQTALHSADSEAVIELLLDAGADINAQDGQGDTLLMRLVQENHDFQSIDSIRLLLARGASITLKNQEGDTVIDVINASERPEELFRVLRDFYPEVANAELKKIEASERARNAKARAEEEKKKKEATEQKKEQKSKGLDEEEAVSLDEVE